MQLLPSLKQLNYLVALADTQHFGQASERCNVTASTLSAGIQDLENILGAPVAERTKRQVLMTPLGGEIAARARLLLRDAQDLMALAASNREPLAGPMRLGVIPTISPFCLPRVLPSLHRQFPALRLFLREERTEQLLNRLRQGELDIALIALPYDVEGLAFRILFEDEFAFACNEKHPLAARKRVTPSDLADQPLLLLEEGHCLRGHALDACQLHEAKFRAQFEASSLHTLVQMVASGIGVTLLPKLAIDAHITRGTKIRIIPLTNKASRQIGLVWRQSSLRGREVALLAEHFSSHLRT